MKSRLAASEMCATSKPSRPRGAWTFGNRPTTEIVCVKVCADSPLRSFGWLALAVAGIPGTCG